MDGAQLWQTLILAIVQGITEFLPVSSDGHLVVIGNLLERAFGTTSTEAARAQLIIGLHFGTLLATITVYWNELWSLFRRRQLLIAVILGTIPAGVIGVVFKDWFEETMSSPLFAGIGLCVTAIFLLAGQRMELNLLELDRIPWPHAIAVGFFQALAILPGVSRSGSTISSGLMIGFTRQTATTYSFLLSVPAVGGAVLLKVIDMIKGQSGGLPIGQLFFGAVISFVVGIAVLRLLIRIVTQNRLHWLAYYCLTVGICVTVWQLWLRMQPT